MNSFNTREDNRFNCPIDGCVYAINGDKYFKRKLFLTQHIANKHSEKKYSCDKCLKKYAIEWQLKYHQKSCGLQWSCDSCDKSYIERLSLVMHCKRHSHNLPKNALIKTSKTALKSPQINVQLLILPLILDSNTSSNQLAVNPNQRLINILPKSDDFISQNSFGTQTSVTEECNRCKVKSDVETIASNVKKINSISTQTDRLSQKSCKSGEQRSTECQTIRKRNRKPQMNNNFESIETQTLESTLHLTESSMRTNCQKISASTSTSPPKKNKRKCLLNNNNNKVCDDFNGFNVKKSCAFTQTVKQLCTSTATTTEDSEIFVNNCNPLLSQMDSTNNILEQSVQTEAIEFCFDNEFNNIETQTVNLDISSDDLLDFGSNEDFLFSEFTDIETQTIWNNDRTTQTDEYLDQINDVFLRYLDNENECHNISNKTVFTDTQTQTQIDFPLLTCSSAQTSQTFS